jgi:hypothetical protein
MEPGCTSKCIFTQFPHLDPSAGDEPIHPAIPSSAKLLDNVKEMREVEFYELSEAPILSATTR